MSYETLHATHSVRLVKRMVSYEHHKTLIIISRIIKFHYKLYHPLPPPPSPRHLGSSHPLSGLQQQAAVVKVRVLAMHLLWPFMFLYAPLWPYICPFMSLSVITVANDTCKVSPHHVSHRAGYIASLATQETGCGTARKPYVIQVRHINMR